MPANVANAANQIYKIIEEATAEWDTLRRRRGGRTDIRTQIESGACVGE